MMISELTNEELLDLLMTSEFSEDHKPDDLKYLLMKFRYFYRILNGKSDLLKIEKDAIIIDINDIKKDNDNKIQQLLYIIAQREDMINSLKNRKLTFKERISGKIITIKNEDTRL